MSEEIRRYYDQQVVQEAGITGAGLVWFMGRDHLSPSYVNRDEIALNAGLWRLGASERCLNLFQAMGIRDNELVLDVGSGIGGPGRDLQAAFNSQIVGINLSLNQLISLRQLSRLANPDNPSYTSVINADVQALPLTPTSFDHAFSINVFYHIPNPDLAIAEISRVLKGDGRFGLDDWFLTDQASDRTIDTLRLKWSTSPQGFHRFSQITNLMRQHGLRVTWTFDYTYEAAAFLTEERFGRVFDQQVRSRLIEVFPRLYQYPGYQPAHAVLAADQLREDILYMGEVYRNGQVVYRQLLVEKF